MGGCVAFCCLKSLFTSSSSIFGKGDQCLMCAGGEKHLRGTYLQLFKEWHGQINTFVCLTSKRMIHKKQLSDFTPAHFLSGSLFPSRIPELHRREHFGGRWARLILRVSISEAVFFCLLSLWGSQSAVRLSSQRYVRRDSGRKKACELSSRCRSTSSRLEASIFRDKLENKPLCSAAAALRGCAAVFCPPLCSSQGQLSPINVFSVLWGVAECGRTTANETKSCDFFWKGEGSCCQIACAVTFSLAADVQIKSFPDYRGGDCLWGKLIFRTPPVPSTFVSSLELGRALTGV